MTQPMPQTLKGLTDNASTQTAQKGDYHVNFDLNRHWLPKLHDIDPEQCLETVRSLSVLRRTS